MATLKDPNTGIEQKIETASQAARVKLFNAQGDSLTKISSSAITATDEILITGGVNDGNIRQFRTDRTGGQAIALNTVLLTEAFEGAVIASSRWASIAITMTATQAPATGLTFNAGNITTINTGYLLKSLRSFAKPQRALLHTKKRARIAHVANSVAEIGFGDATTFNGANSNGAYWQVTSGGVVQAVLTYNSLDITSAPVTGLSPSNYYTWDVILDDDSAYFSIQDSSTGQTIAERTIFLPVTQPKLWTATRLFEIARLYNTGSAPASAPSMVVSAIDTVMMDVSATMPWKEQMAASGYGGQIQPVTFAQAAQWANSAAPASATLSNTAAGYTTKGGLFQFAAVAGAATDYVLFAYQAPTPYSFVCTGIEIELWNTGAPVAVTPTLFVWGIGIDQSAASLATAGIIREGIGSQSLPIGAAIGANAPPIIRNFDVPLVTNPGRFMTVILRMPVGTATVSEIFQGMVNLRGYYN